MKGKNKSKRKKVGTVIMLAMSFILTIVLTSTITLAWFYDSQWASKNITMAGAVGIEMRDKTNAVTSGTGNLHFSVPTAKAYPGQAVDVSAKVFNNGGSSITQHFSTNPPAGENPTDSEIEAAGATGVGSPCYVRAHFKVYTDIGKDLESDVPDQAMNARLLYNFLQALITTQNTTAGFDYYWTYYQNTTAKVLDGKSYLNGVGYSEGDANFPASFADDGYFYLCYRSYTATSGDVLTNCVLKPLNVGSTAVFLWNDRFVIPWQLTNLSADKNIYIGLTFQAIQTFVPIIEGGTISKAQNNQLAAELCTYDSIAVQTIFNSSKFKTIDFGAGFDADDYTSVDKPV